MTAEQGKFQQQVNMMLNNGSSPVDISRSIYDDYRTAVASPPEEAQALRNVLERFQSHDILGRTCFRLHLEASKAMDNNLLPDNVQNGYNDTIVLLTALWLMQHGQYDMEYGYDFNALDQAGLAYGLSHEDVMGIMGRIDGATHDEFQRRLAKPTEDSKIQLHIIVEDVKTYGLRSAEEHYEKMCDDTDEFLSVMNEFHVGVNLAWKRWQILSADA